MAEREQALIGILERLAAEMTQQDTKLAALSAQQTELSNNIKMSNTLLRGTQTGTERSYGRISDTISHYRSDMLSLVKEQDQINSNIEELFKQLKATTYTADIVSKKLVELDERLAKQEKASKEHYEHSIKQTELLKNEIRDSSRESIKYHSSTEKRLAELQNEITQSLNSYQHETLRRLLLLDGIIESLQILITRTEPHKKEPVFIKRVFIKIKGFFRRRLPFLTKNK